MKATNFLGPEGARAVEDAVRRAEAASNLEVACVVATESGRYDRAEGLWGLAFGLVGMGLAELAWLARPAAGAWSEPISPWVLALGVVVGFLVGNVFASYVHPVRRLMVGAGEMDDEVDRAAAAAFTRCRVGTTASRTGLLVYVSLFERRVVVLLDEAVRKAAGADLASRLCDQAVQGLGAGRTHEVLVELIDAAAEQLKDKLPPREDDVDELANRVVVLHPR